ncbi:MAG: glycoside hydrolase [Clostridia bacterium]|nr:glycoside hydrolase [Clostridia bacterium]
MKELEKMTLREKIGQLFIVLPGALEQAGGEFLGGTELTDAMRDRYVQYPFGGFCLLRGNLEGPEQLRRFTAALHTLGPVRPVLTIDEEGGQIARIANHPAGFDVPHMAHTSEIGRSHDPEQAYSAGNRIGQYLKGYGLDVDFAPVADVLTNPDNQLMRNRSYGSDPDEVAAMAVACLEGLRAAGILGCLKHFPGHGNTVMDTHEGKAETRRTWEEMRSCEMRPFEAGIRAGVRMIMTAHVSVPAITGTDVPATLSGTMLTGKLRGELGYDGVIITDALSMGAIHSRYTPEEAAVGAFLAGADLLLLPADPKAAFEGMVRAVEDGRISTERLDGSVRRILDLKDRIAAGALTEGGRTGI